MTQTTGTSDRDDPHGLNRFTQAQENIYDHALSELSSGQKRSHWMWFIFPQIDGLGHSETAKHFAIKSLAEARQYFNHPVLGPRLLECTEAVLAVEGRSVSTILGYPDDLKLKSSMTLFSQVTTPESVFNQVLEKYFDGKQDAKTLEILENIQRS